MNRGQSSDRATGCIPWPLPEIPLTAVYEYTILRPGVCLNLEAVLETAARVRSGNRYSRKRAIGL